MPTSKRGQSDAESRAADSQRKSEKHARGHFEFVCDICSLVFAEAEMKIQHGQRVCHSCYEPEGDVVDRDAKRAFAAKYAAQLEAGRRLPKYPFALESAPWIEAFVPNPVVLIKEDPFGNLPTATLVVLGGRLDEVAFTFPLGVVVVSVTFSDDATIASFELQASDDAVAGDYPILADGSAYHSKVRILETLMDPDLTYLRLDGANNGSPLTWATDTDVTAGIAAAIAALAVGVTAPLQSTGSLGGNDLELSVLTFGAAQAGVVPSSGGGTVNFLRADGAWVEPPGAALFTSVADGIVGASGGGTATYLRADGNWATPPGSGGAFDGGTIGNPILAADGSAALPSYSYSGEGTLGRYRSGAGAECFSSAGVARLKYSELGIELKSDCLISWLDDAIGVGAADLSMRRIDVGILSIHGENSTVVRVGGDGQTGLVYASLGHDGTNATLNTTTGAIRLTYIGGEVARVNASGIDILGNGRIGWTPIEGDPADTMFSRGSAGVALFHKDISGLSSIRVHGDGATGALYASISADGAASYFYGQRTSYFGAVGDYVVNLVSNNVPRWSIYAVAGGSAFVPAANGTQNIGSTSAYVATLHVNTIRGSSNTQFTKQYVSQKVVTTYAASQTVDWNSGNCHEITLTGNITTLTLSNPISGGRYILKLTHSGGSRTVAWPASVKWPAATAPTLSASGKTDVIALFYDGTNYFATAALDF